MDVRSGRELGSGIPFRVLVYIPFPVINSLANAQIQSELFDDLPSETEIGPTAQTVGGRNGKGIEHIVLIEIDPVVPFAGIEGLKAETQAYW